MLSRESTRLLKARCSVRVHRGQRRDRGVVDVIVLRSKSVELAAGSGVPVPPDLRGPWVLLNVLWVVRLTAAMAVWARLAFDPPTSDPARLVVSDAFAVGHAAGGAEVRP